MRLSGKTAIVTGCASGIGRVVAERFVAEGASVWCFDKAIEALPSGTLHDQAAGLRAVDITDEDELRQAFDEVNGRIDVVVANAAVQLIGDDSSVWDVPVDVWRHTIDVNLFGTFLTVRFALLRMLEQETRNATRGSVIVTGSPTAMTGAGAGFAAYASSKAGVRGLVKSAAMDVARKGIRVNTVVPGHTLTPLVDKLRRDEETARRIDEGIPVGRPADALETVGAYVYLASDESVYATASEVFVDGGLCNL